MTHNRPPLAPCFLPPFLYKNELRLPPLRLPPSTFHLSTILQHPTHTLPLLSFPSSTYSFNIRLLLPKNVPCRLLFHFHLPAFELSSIPRSAQHYSSSLHLLLSFAACTACFAYPITYRNHVVLSFNFSTPLSHSFAAALSELVFTRGTHQSFSASSPDP